MMLYRLYGKEQVARAVSLVNNGETLAHKAARGGLYNLLVDQMIGQLGFDLDFYQPDCKLTVIN